MSKRNAVTFNRPEEPTFLKRIKEQVGYKEGPTVDTKRQDLGPAEDFADDTQDEQPTVVVLEPGDLTAEEAEDHQNQRDRETEESPANLDAPIVFKAPGGKKKETDCEQEEPPKKKSKKAAASNKALLSFNDDDDEDDC